MLALHHSYLLSVCAMLMPSGVTCAHKHINSCPSATPSQQGTCCFNLMMVGFGQSNRRAAPKRKTGEKQSLPEEKAAVAAAELPADAFSQFPPLSAQQQRTLKRAEDLKGDGFPPEVRILTSAAQTR